MLEIKLDNMKEEYKNLVYDLSRYYNSDKYIEVESGKAWMKVLLNSTYGAYSVSHRYFEKPINEKRSDKLNRILNESK